MEVKEDKEEKKDERKEQALPGTLMDLVRRRRPNSAFHVELDQRMRAVESHLARFAGMDMADTVLPKQDALQTWMEKRLSGFNLAVDGLYSMAELMWVILCLQHVAQKRPEQRLSLQPVHILSTFRDLCTMGRRAQSREIPVGLANDIFDKCAAIVHGVINRYGMDSLLVQLGVDSSELTADELKTALAARDRESKGEAKGEEEAKRVMAAVDSDDPESDEAKREMQKKLEKSPLESIPKAVQGFVLFGSRIFWNVWAAQHVQALYPMAHFDITVADLRAYSDHMTALCELEPLEESTNRVVELHLRRHTMVGALQFLRRGEINSSEKFSPSSIIQTEISVVEFNKLVEEASLHPLKIWQDEKSSAARQALAVEVFSRQFSYQFRTSAEALGVKQATMATFSKYCFLSDELVDHALELTQTKTGLQTRRPIFVDLPCGWCVHHQGKYWSCEPRTFETAGVIWARIMERDFKCRLACGTIMTDLIREFLTPAVVSFDRDED